VKVFLVWHRYEREADEVLSIHLTVTGAERACREAAPKRASAETVDGALTFHSGTEWWEVEKREVENEPATPPAR